MCAPVGHSSARFVQPDELWLVCVGRKHDCTSYVLAVRVLEVFDGRTWVSVGVPEKLSVLNVGICVLLLTSPPPGILESSN